MLTTKISDEMEVKFDNYQHDILPVSLSIRDELLWLTHAELDDLIVTLAYYQRLAGSNGSR